MINYYYNEFKNKSDVINDEYTKKIVKDIIEYKYWFRDTDIDTFINVLKSMNYSKYESIEIYKKLIGCKEES